MSGIANLKDVANFAGVSVSTVSQVLNGRTNAARISDETAQRVLEASAKLNYRPNLNARRLKNSTAAIPTLAFLGATNAWPFFLSTCLETVQRMITEGGRPFHVVLCPYRTSELHLSKVFTSPCEYDGIIVANASDEDLAFLNQAEILTPTVLLNRASKKYFYVYLSEEHVAARLFELLKSKNLRKLGLMLVTNENIANMAHVTTRVLEKAEAEGIEIRKDWIAYCGESDESRYEAVENLLCLDERPEVIFFPNGRMAMYATKILAKHGLRVPDDLRIISYGGQELLKYLTPSITTIEIPIDAMAEKCCEMLLDVYDNKPFMKWAEYYAKVHYMESFEM